MATATEREQFVALLVGADLAIAQLAIQDAINETVAIIGQPYDQWREAIIGVKQQLDQVQEQIRRGPLWNEHQ